MDDVDVEDDAGQDIAENICPDGDVILVVGPLEVRLRVHSKTLSSASKVFRIMFGPNFSEGQNLSETSPKDIPLPEDNAKALRDICCILHHKSDLVSDPDGSETSHVLEIAIVTDKYDLLGALSLANHALQEKALGCNTEHNRLAQIMAAAYLCKNMEVFTDTSMELLLDQCESYLGLLVEDRVKDILPAATACKNDGSSLKITNLNKPLNVPPR